MAYILYIAKDKKNPTRHDLGSLICMQQLSQLPEGFVHVQECSPTEHPLEVTGTPTLRSQQHGTMQTGNAAVQQLMALSVRFAEQRGRSDAAAEEAAKKKTSRPTSNFSNTFPPRPPAARNTHLRPETARSPPSPPLQQDDDGAAGGGGVEDLFVSQLNDEDLEDEDDEVDSTTRKITSDDLARHNQRRDVPQATQQVQQPPSLPPLNSKTN